MYESIHCRESVAGRAETKPSFSFSMLGEMAPTPGQLLTVNFLMPRRVNVIGNIALSLSIRKACFCNRRIARSGNEITVHCVEPAFPGN